MYLLNTDHLSRPALRGSFRKPRRRTAALQRREVLLIVFSSLYPHFHIIFRHRMCHSSRHTNLNVAHKKWNIGLTIPLLSHKYGTIKWIIKANFTLFISIYINNKNSILTSTFLTSNWRKFLCILYNCQKNVGTITCQAGRSA